MAETHPGRFVGNSGRETTVVDAQPWLSARIFKYLSDAVDAVLDKRSEANRGILLPEAIIESVLPPSEALMAVHGIVAAIDKRFAVANCNQALELNESAGEADTVVYGSQVEPRTARLISRNWDKISDTRRVGSNEESRLVRFTDGHHDYVRELAVEFRLGTAQSTRTLSYRMVRNQAYQDQPINLNLTLQQEPIYWQEDVGGIAYSRQITEEQEIKVLKSLASIGGFALDDFPSKS